MDIAEEMIEELMNENENSVDGPKSCMDQVSETCADEGSENEVEVSTTQGIISSIFETIQLNK